MIETKPITPLKSKKFPKHLVFFDTETHIHEGDSFEPHTFRLGVFTYVHLNENADTLDREVIHFSDQETFWKYITTKAKKHKNLFVFAHNISYDLIATNVSKIESYGFKIGNPIMENNFVLTCQKYRIVTTKDGKERKINQGKITFVDMFNYVRMSLAEVGKKFGIRKKKVDLKNDNDSKIARYCEVDVNICERFILSLIRFIVKNNLGSFRNTIASLSFDVWRQSFMETEVFYHYNRPSFLMERKAYKGGRVECFYIGKPPRGNYYKLDFNSEYPTVMKGENLPTKLLYKRDKISIEQLKELIKDYYVIADVSIDHKRRDIGLFAVKTADKLIFHRGKYRETFHHPELVRALQENMVKRVHSVLVYERAKIFKKYVEYFYDLKTKSKGVDRELAKLFLNALYGRFGMKRYRSQSEPYTGNKIHGTILSGELGGKKTLKYIWFGEQIWTEKSEEIPHKNVNVALAGAVCAYGRMMILDAVEKAGVKNCFYLDTDSVIVNHEGYKRLAPLIDGSRMGYLKCEGMTRHIEIITNKHYTFGTKTCHKGLPTNHYLDETGKFVFWRFTKIKDWIRTGDFGRKLVAKELTMLYSKGVIASGQQGRVEPMEYGA